jgi:casein kinase 1
MLADQMITALEYLHKKSFLHRDVKPDNFLIGQGNRASQLFVIDFGLSKKYRNPETHEHIGLATGKSLTGTARYASINALKGLEQSRRDDMEALGYCFLYLLAGSLPWMGLDARDRKQKYQRICEVKVATSLESLCRPFPHEFLMYLRHVRSLQFEELPAYALYRHWFRELFLRSGFLYDYQYDWVEAAPRRLPEPVPHDPGGSVGAVVPSSAISKTTSEDQAAPPLAPVALSPEPDAPAQSPKKPQRPPREPAAAAAPPGGSTPPARRTVARQAKLK